MSDYYPEVISIGPLFCGLPLFRNCDPPTSKSAGRRARSSGLVSEHERLILQALEAGPGTKDDIAARCGLTEQQVARRRAAMERDGKVELTGERRRTPSGNTAEVWRLALERTDGR